MQTAKIQKTKRRQGALESAIALLLLAIFSQAAQALLLKIDPARSEIRSIPSAPFCLFDHLSGELVCPPPTAPRSFTMTGSMDVSVIHQQLEFGGNYPAVERDLLYLKTMGLSTDAHDQGFYLNSEVALLTGETFEARGDDPCFLFVGPGSCSGWVLLFGAGHSEGTWDGNTLVWNGYVSPLITLSGMTGSVSMIDAFNYTIVASAVPEPGTLSLMLLVLPLALYFGFPRTEQRIDEMLEAA